MITAPHTDVADSRPTPAARAADPSALLDALLASYPDLFPNTAATSTTATPPIATHARSDLAAALFTDPPTERLLHGLVECDRAREKLRGVVDEADEWFADAHDRDAKRIQRTLSHIGITPDTLSRNGAANLSLLADLALELRLDTASAACDPATYQIAMSSLVMDGIAADAELAEQEELAREVDAHYSRIDVQCRRADAVLTSLADGEELQRQRTREWTHNARMLEEKGEEYADRLHSVEERIDPSLPSYTPAALLDLADKVDAMQIDLANKRAVLKGFADLPPDPVLAKLKLAQRKMELRGLIERKQEILSSIARGMS
ncbi:HAUS augmin-like complex subunit 1 [Geranomyces variabilis]|uniref:HAUS augmin-like complex subunit 1 n=1 Tax=Geranomyces variabilis TaxID=109894 RepID=A0AAD5XP43_9FUNG|nr:HAUS augmin-like complex subunit 1 [Geranomyces variabilis]